MKKKYVLIGGNPMSFYTGSPSFTGVHIVGELDSLNEIQDLAAEKYEECGGLLFLLDTETNQEVSWGKEP